MEEIIEALLKIYIETAKLHQTLDEKILVESGLGVTASLLEKQGYIVGCYVNSRNSIVNKSYILCPKGMDALTTHFINSSGMQYTQSAELMHHQI